jgi:hypothetical protein
MLFFQRYHDLDLSHLLSFYNLLFKFCPLVLFLFFFPLLFYLFHVLLLLQVLFSAIFFYLLINLIFHYYALYLFINYYYGFLNLIFMNYRLIHSIDCFLYLVFLSMSMPIIMFFLPSLEWLTFLFLLLFSLLMPFVLLVVLCCDVQFLFLPIFQLRKGRQQIQHVFH